ncbi:unnamed protein product [Eruca vesicaria subsp. sativa]|uniref:Uncharacterized protein n=1 Tax=Eruca vesicaria subsp. sativa TaxID=29727 RepID=A0ABC8KIW1_ERUVS|nr:unnamed protein product [Eruca vesicaria subsp. sativa]
MGDIIGHNDREIWLPSHLLQDPLFDHSNKHQNSLKNHNYHHHGSGGFLPPCAPPLRKTFPWNYNTRKQQQNSWQMSKGEDRMQAFFLVPPGRTTSGTGVFLPTTASHPSNKKPACSPVFLPARVVQALNLNVHNNGVLLSPRSGNQENDSRKKSELVETPTNTEVETPTDPPEKLLPEEWIY